MIDFGDGGTFSDLQAAIMRRNFGQFAKAYMASRGFAPAAHHWLMIRALQEAADGIGPRGLIFELPPGSAKSTYVSKLFPAWWMARRRDQKIIGSSSTGKLAEKFSGEIHDIIRDWGAVLGYGLKSEAKEAWNADNGGEYAAVGIDGSGQGLRSDLTVMDDPFKSRREAESPTIREIAWSFWQSVIEPRQKPGALKVIVTTRWHMDDLVGRLLATQPDKWRRIRLRAQAVAGEEDPLGRAPGEFLWGDDGYGYAQVLRDAKERLIASHSMREWWALYQQEPRPAEGGLFDVDKIRIVEALAPVWTTQPPANLPPNTPPPVGRRTVRAWDIAATAQTGKSRDPDWTVGTRLCTDGRRTTIEDVVRVRMSGTDVIDKIRQVAVEDGRGVPIRLPQDPGAAGKAWAQYQAAALAGFIVRTERPTGKKEVRAAAFAAQVGAGNVDMVRGPWNGALIEELRDFPHGDHDDQVDAASDAFNELHTGPSGAASVQSLY